MIEIAIDQNLSVEEKSAAIGNLLLEIEHESFLLGKKLEGIVEKISAEMPKVEQEIDRLEIQKLKADIETVQESVNQRHIKSQSVEIISQLDKALEKVKSIQTCLKDADNWNSVPAEMEALFASNNFEKIIVRLREAESSLNLLSASSNPVNVEERKKLLAQFKARARSLLVEKLTCCLESEEYQEGKSAVYDLEKLSSISDAFKVVFEFKKDSLMESFNNEIGTDSFIHMLTGFLSAFMSKLQKDTQVFENLFDQPRNATSFLVSQAMSQIKPKVLSALEAMSLTGPQSILLITEVYQAFVDFGVQFESIYPVPNRARTSIIAEQCVDWGKPIFDSFLPFQMDYESLERKYLSFRAQNINLLDGIDILNELSKRYLIFTSGVIKLDFHSLIDWFLCSVIDREIASTLIAPSNTDGMFSRQIDSLKDAICFIQKGNALWKELDISLQEEILTCSSSKTALKSLKREYQVSDSKQCSFSAKGLELIKVCQKKVLDAILVPVEDMLHNFAELPCWSMKEPAKILVPLTCVTNLGEYVLTLPQLFDQYSQDQTLSFSLKTLPMVTDFLLSEGGDNDNPEVVYDSTHIWIISAARIIEDCYAGHILLIPSLSSSGMKQLLADTDYLQNVLSAIEIEPFGRMADLVYGLSLNEEALKEEALRNDLKHDPVILKCILKMRTKIN